MNHVDLLQAYVDADKALASGELSQEKYDAAVADIQRECGDLGHIPTKPEGGPCIICYSPE